MQFYFLNFVDNIKKKVMNLKGKNALITGGGRGLGKAVAIALANEGVM